MEYCSNFEYDLKLGQIKEKELAYVFNHKTIEVKKVTDAIYNVFVEYECRGKKSGISTSQSDYYCFAFKDTFLIIKTETLKDKCRKYIGTDRDKKGGDNNTSSGILLPINELCTNQ